MNEDSPVINADYEERPVINAKTKEFLPKKTKKSKNVKFKKSN